MDEIFVHTYITWVAYHAMYYEVQHMLHRRSFHPSIAKNAISSTPKSMPMLDIVAEFK